MNHSEFPQGEPSFSKSSRLILGYTRELDMQSFIPSRFLLLLCVIFVVTNARAESMADADFSARCAGPGVIWCVGFDDQSQVNTIGQTRYPATSGSASIAEDAQSYPNNIAPNGYRYPAVDTSQAASGAGSLRLTANPIGSANQSGGWYLGSAGISPWPETFAAGQTLYVQWRQRYDFAYTNQVDWNSVGGSVKQIILWRDGSSCSDLQVVVVDSEARGYPQAYTNCGNRPLYQCPSGSSNENCSAYNTNYEPKAGHIQFLYQYGPESDDFDCMRNSETAPGCGYWKDYHDRWWTYYLEIKIGASGQPTSQINAWMSRGNGEPMRQFIDFGAFPWSYNSGKSIENLLFTLYSTSKTSGNHVVATSWYDELIISSQPIPAPEGLGNSNGTSCIDGIPRQASCPPEGFQAN